MVRIVVLLLNILKVLCLHGVLLVGLALDLVVGDLLAGAHHELGGFDSHLVLSLNGCSSIVHELRMVLKLLALLRVRDLLSGHLGEHALACVDLFLTLRRVHQIEQVLLVVVVRKARLREAGLLLEVCLLKS